VLIGHTWNRLCILLSCSDDKRPRLHVAIIAEWYCLQMSSKWPWRHVSERSVVYHDITRHNTNLIAWYFLFFHSASCLVRTQWISHSVYCCCVPNGADLLATWCGRANASASSVLWRLRNVFFLCTIGLYTSCQKRWSRSRRIYHIVLSYWWR